MNNVEGHGELKVIFPTDCGNAPKRIVLKDFNIALANKDKSYITDSIVDDIQWTIVGNSTIQGKEHFLNTLDNITDKVIELHFHHLITHGKEAAVHGTLLMNGDSRLSFCHMYSFSSAGKRSKIKEITSYIIKTS